MSKISEKVSQILGFTIKEGEWQRYVTPLDKEGEPTRKHMAELLFAVCAEIESIRADIDTLFIKEKYVEGTKKGRKSEDTI